MNNRQYVALAYLDEKVVGNIIEKDSYMYVLMPRSRRINH